MQIFKVYCKVFRKNGVAFCFLFILVYGVICALTANSSTNTSATSFDPALCSVGIIDQDDSEFSCALRSYLDERTDLMDINEADGEDGIRDGLFSAWIRYGIIIPEGYEASFLSGKPLDIKSFSAADSANSVMVGMLLENYLNTAALYRDTTGIDYDAIAEDMAQGAEVKVADTYVNENNGTDCFFVNYLVYPILAILLSCIPMVMLTMNETDLRRRNFCSPIKNSFMTTQLFLGNGVIALLTYVMLLAIIFICRRSVFSGTRGLLWSANIFLFLLISLALSFLFSNISKKSTVTPIANLVSLGTCFLGGVFVPQAYLSDGLLKAATINPAFWYIKANEEINQLTEYSLSSMQTLGRYVLIELSFAVAFFALALALGKRRNTQ